MFKPSFETLRLFGFLPFTYDSTSKSYKKSHIWLIWSQFFYGSNCLLTLWRAYYYIIIIYPKTPITQTFIYKILIMQEPLIDIAYYLILFYPIFVKGKLKKLQKCLNLLEDISFEEASLTEKSLFFATVLPIGILTGSVVFILKQMNEIYTLPLELDYVFVLLLTFIQCLSLMQISIFYCVLLNRLKVIDLQLREYCCLKKTSKLHVTSYFQCISLIRTLESLNFFILRNVWLICVYDFLCTYESFRLFISQWNDEETSMVGIIGAVSCFWNIMIVPTTFFLMNLADRCRKQVKFIISHCHY